MNKTFLTYNLSLTEGNQNVPEVKFPKITQSPNPYTNFTSMSVSPHETQCYTSSNFCAQVPQLDYLQYKEKHNSKKRGHKTRYESDSPHFNYFYQPQYIRVSPRSKVKVFSCFPIPEKSPTLKSRTKKNNRLNLSKFNNQPRVLPLINTKITPPEQDINPAFTYGEKLWKLNELAALE